MAGVQRKEQGIIAKGSVINLKELNVDDLKRIIALQHRENVVKNDRLRGVEKLTTICSDLEEKLQSSQTKAENYGTALRRAEARIAYLNKKLGIGPQTTFDIDVINPGVSRKDFDAVTKENIRLKEALEHIVPTELGGKDIVIKNKELYELVTTLQDDLARREHHIKELEETLHCSNKDDLAAKVNELTKLSMKLERSMQAKQVFSEKLLKENRRLNEIVDQKGINQQMLYSSRDIPDGQAAEDKTILNENAAARNDISNEEREKLLKAIEERDKLVSERDTYMRRFNEITKALEKRVSELTTEMAQINERKAKTEAELSETARKCADFQKKCAGFFNQVVSLNSKQLESEEEISSFKRIAETLRAQVAEKEPMMVMMRDALNTHESDFRREHDEKLGYQKRMETSQQESERLKRENQSHMATIRHFESEIERMSKLLTDQKNINKNTSSFPVHGFGQPFGSSASRGLFHERTAQPIVVADGAGGVNESSRQGSQSKSSPTLIECPYCSRSYPYHLIEGHVQDCMEDSLYMDD